MNFFQKKVDLALKDVKHRKVYSVADWFLKEKERIEKYLCHVTDDLFRPTNRIMLFDLTNFYFEGRKEGSQKAQYGRSKENRRDEPNCWCSPLPSIPTASSATVPYWR